MRYPIGGPRFWRRLVSRWWRPDARMQREWEQRAQADAFGYIGRGYAEDDARFWSSGETDVARLLLDGLECAPGAAVLEIGCGVGRLLRPLAQRFATVHGVDIAPGMIARGRELLADRPNVRLHVTDGSLPMIAAASLDLVCSFVVFQHIPGKRAIRRYFRESARVLKPGGIFKFQVDGRERPFWRGADTWLGAWFSPAQMHAEMRRAGFEIVDSWGEATQYFWITARRAGPPAPDLQVRAGPPRWHEPGLTALLDRLACRRPDATAAIARGELYLRDCVRAFLRTHHRDLDGAFVAAAFQEVLGRTADADGLAFYQRQLAGGATRPYVIDCLLSSAELRAQVRR